MLQVQHNLFEHAGVGPHPWQAVRQTEVKNNQLFLLYTRSQRPARRDRRRNEQVSRSFEAGEADRPTLVTAGIELATIELAQFEASVQQRQAMGALEDALQYQLFEPAAALIVPEITLLPNAELMP